MPKYKEFKFDSQFDLESGESLSGFKLAYQTFGTLNKNKSKKHRQGFN